jgi:hypothetical protein
LPDVVKDANVDGEDTSLIAVVVREGDVGEYVDNQVCNINSYDSSRGRRVLAHRKRKSKVKVVSQNPPSYLVML